MPSETKQAPKVQKVQKQIVAKPSIPKAKELDLQPIEKTHEISTPVASDVKPLDKKSQKKEKKTVKPIPEDFALFSTPDIIRRVGGKDSAMPQTPSTPESPSILKPLKISPESRSKSSSERLSGSSKPTRLSTELKILNEDAKLSLSPDKIMQEKPKQYRRTSLDKTKALQKSPLEKNVDKRCVDVAMSNKINTDMVEIQNLNDNTNSSEVPSDSTEQIPTAEDIRSIILNENTKSFTTSLVLPETNEMNLDQQQNLDHGNINLETGTLDLDQSILDNINSDLISEDILYQVAKQLVDNTDLQNVIDKSLVDGNLVLDPSIQNAMIQNDQDLLEQSTVESNEVLIFYQ